MLKCRNNLEGIRHFANSSRRHGGATGASSASTDAAISSSSSSSRLYRGRSRFQALRIEAAGKTGAPCRRWHLLSNWTIKTIRTTGRSDSTCRASRSKARLGAIPFTDPASTWSSTSTTSAASASGRRPSTATKWRSSFRVKTVCPDVRPRRAPANRENCRAATIVRRRRVKTTTEILTARAKPRTK